MARLQRRPFDRPTDVRRFANGHVDVVELDDTVIGRFVLEPGWRWSRDVGPTAGTPLCQYRHVGAVVTGVLLVEMEDGTQSRIGPGDVFEIPAGHDAEVVSDEPWVAIDFAGGRSFAQTPEERGDRILASIVFTDIVGSTALAEQIGDRAWTDLLARHNDAVGQAIDRFRGRQIKTTGDGVVALFDGAERAVHCAEACRAAAADLGLSIRTGIHTGEVELAAGDIRGVTVHVAARIMDLAAPGEILISATTRDLLAGSDLAFEEAGSHELKGLVGSRPVFRLAAPV